MADDKPGLHGSLKAFTITQTVVSGLGVLGQIYRLITSSPGTAEQALANFGRSLGGSTPFALLMIGGILMLRGKRSGMILSEIIYGLFVLGFLAAGIMMGSVAYILIWGGIFSLPLLYFIKSKRVFVAFGHPFPWRVGAVQRG